MVVFERIESVMKRGRNANYALVHRIELVETEGELCTTIEVEGRVDVVMIASKVAPADKERQPDSFLEVLQNWGHTWLWDKLHIAGAEGQGLNLRITSGIDWIWQAIEDCSLVAVSDGLYIKQRHPHLCSCVLIMECAKGRGRLAVSFSEQSLQSNAYRGELMGLIAINLLLLSINEMFPYLKGSVQSIGSGSSTAARITANRD